MDFERARMNMIEQQIRTWSVLDQEVLDLLTVVRREEFVPPQLRAMAFTDMELPLTVEGKATGETMFAPKTEARILQELAVRKHESVLEIGAGSGYMAALLAHRARHVDTLEILPGLAGVATDNLRRAGIANVTVRQADASDPGGNPGTYDVVVLSGGVSFVPDFILKRVNPGGRLTAIVGDAPVMRAQILARAGDTAWNTTTLFETLAKPLTGFPVRQRFRF